MTKRRFWLPAVLTLVACGGEDAVPERETPTPQRNEVTPTEWTRIAPGVWERVREDGVHEQQGIGLEAAEFELRRVRGERALLEQVRSRGDSPESFGARLKESDKLIRVLESGIAEALKTGVLEQTPDSPPVRTAQGTEGTQSGGICAGYYGFDVQFSYSMAGGGVTTQGGWTEFGPFGPFTKEMYVYAKGWLYNANDPAVDEQSASTGPFANTCCVSIQASASAYPTFTPVMEGGGVIFGSNGCGFRSYRAWNY